MHSSFCLIRSSHSSPWLCSQLDFKAAPRRDKRFEPTAIWESVYAFTQYGHAQLSLASHFPLVRVAHIGTKKTDFILHVLIYLLMEIKRKEGSCKCHSSKSSNFRQGTWPTCLASTRGLYLVLRGSPAFLRMTIAFSHLHALSSPQCLDQKKESKYNYT